MKALDLAYIVTDYINSKGDAVSPKKLQKLLYYIDAWHLVYFGEPLLEEDFQAWVHGPVIPELYKHLKEHGFNNIEVIDDELDDANERIEKAFRKEGISKGQQELIYAVLDKYGSLSAFQLELLTHNERPWLEARGDVAPHER